MVWKMAYQWWCQISLCKAAPARRSKVRHRGDRDTIEIVPCETLEARTVPTALTIIIDYSYDTNHFFDTKEKKDLFQQAADTYAARIVDNLAGIAPSGHNTWAAEFTDPSTGQTVQVQNLYVGSDTIIVFAGGRNLEGNTLGVGGPGGYSATGTSTWLATVDRRGQTGAAGSRPTDFGPWGGSITFDTHGTNWFFGATTNGLDDTEIDFMSVAMHELGHVLGFGTAESFDNLVSGGVFNGTKADAEYDFSGKPAVNSDASHWADGVTDGGQETAMDPSIPQGSRKFLTNLDWAAFDDIGWTLATASPAELPTIALPGSIPTHTRGGVRTTIDSEATFANPGGLGFKGVQLQASILGNMGKYDAITIGIGNGITKSGATIKFNGVSIGTYSNGLGSKSFKLTFNSRATDEAIQACLRNLQFYTTSNKASVLDRTIAVRLVNLNGANSAPDTKVVHVA